MQSTKSSRQSNLRLSPATTLAELRQFLHGMPESARIYCGQAGGHTVLYATGRSLRFPTPQAGRQAREKARVAVQDLFSSWGARLEPVQRRDGGLKTADLAAALRKLGPDGPAAPAAAAWLAEPGLEQLPSTLAGAGFQALAALLRRKLEQKPQGGSATMERAAVRLGRKFAAELRCGGRDQQLRFALSDGARFKRELQKELRLTPRQAAAPALAGFLDRVYLALCQNLADHAISGHKLEIGGKQYTYQANLCRTEGAVQVDLYACGAEKIAVKRNLKEGGGPAALAEARSHRHAMGDGASLVLPLKGVLRNSAGEVLIATAYAPHGDVAAMQDRIQAAQKSGRITPHQGDLIRLTLLRDMLGAVHQLHAQRSISHLDLKPGNFFIDERGTARLADFGTAMLAREQMVDHVAVDNPLWLAPEAIAGNQEERKALAALAASKRQILNDPTLGARQKKQRLAALQDTPPRFAISHKADVWSMGVSIYQIWYGRLPFSDERFSHQIQERILAYAALPTAEARKEALHLGSSPFDLALGGMLDPDPARRPGLDQVLSGRIFRHPAIGSPAIRQLISEL